MINIKIKKLVKHAIVPTCANVGDAGVDLYATDFGESEDNMFIEYGTGLAIEIPEGYFGMLTPRGSISKTPLILCNSVGVIDSGYRGEILVRFKRVVQDRDWLEYRVGDKIAQLIILPSYAIKFIETDVLSDTERGQGRFGSSDR